MTENELEALYGPYLAQVRVTLGEAGIARLLAAHDRAAALDADEEHTNPDRLTGLMMTAAGDADLDYLTREMRKREADYIRARDLLMGGIIAQAIVHGSPETEISQRTGISRGAIRRQLGKTR